MLDRRTFSPCPQCQLPTWKRTSDGVCRRCRKCPQCGVKGRRFCNGVCTACTKFFKKHGTFDHPRKAGRPKTATTACSNCGTDKRPFTRGRCRACYNVFNKTGGERKYVKIPCAKCERLICNPIDGLCHRCAPCRWCKAPGPHFIPGSCHACEKLLM